MVKAQLARWVGSLPLAAVITLLLFLTMITLIKTGDRLKQEVNFFAIKDVVMMPRQVEVIDIPDPEPPTELTNLPDLPQPQKNEVIAPVQLTFSRPKVNTGIQFSGAIGGHNSELIPIVRVNPTYPQRASQRGVEGWVVLEFNINTDGQVTDARVIANEPSGVFDRTALRAISRWRYRPRVVDGEPQEVEGVQVRLTFTLTKNDESKGKHNLF